MTSSTGMVECGVCGDPFNDEKPTGRPALYCSDECRYKAHLQYQKTYNHTNRTGHKVKMRKAMRVVRANRKLHAAKEES